MLSGDDRPGRRRATSCSSRCSAPSCTTPAARRHHWGELEIAREQLTDELAADGVRSVLDPDRREHGDRRARLRAGVLRAARAVSTPTACAPAAIVLTSSSGGTHAGLVAGRALLRVARPGDAARRCWRSASPRASSSGCPTSPARRRDAGADRACRRRSPTATSRSTPAGSATTTACRRRPATRPSAGRPATAAGCSTARTPARASPGCSATPPTGRWRGRRRRRVHPHRRAAGRVRSPAVRGTAQRPSSSDEHEPVRHGHERDPRRRPAGVRAGRPRAAAGGRRRRPAQPRDRVRVHQPRPVRRPARHRLRDAPRVLRARRSRPSSGSSRPAPTARPATPACSSRPPRRATSPTGRRCSTGRRRSRPATR